ncbi:hypothetical protein COHCIP112018_02404 [Cohnella sp. JJ-181]|nr:hypothetical protein COHCIP112018_02404 [Cohnella sp. JJ-181]
MEKEHEELPDIPIRLWFAEPPVRSDFKRKSRKTIRRLHGADMEKIVLLPPPVPIDGRRRRPLRSTIFLMFFVRSADWLRRFFRSR